jgi:ABC-type oligopeptide transport system substrate-binding subunit
VVVWTWPGRRAVGEYFRGLLRRLDLRASLHVHRELDYFTVLVAPETRAQIGFGAWAPDYLSPSTFIEPLFGCRASGQAEINLSRFCDARLDRTIARALDSHGATATDAWAAADRRIVDRAPVVPLATRRAVVLTSKRVGEAPYHQRWVLLLDQVWIR